MNFNSATEALPHLLNKLLTEGSVVPSRNGETRELTMQHITLDQTADPYLATPGRKASLPAQIAETMWILAGRNDVGWLSNYLPQAPKFSDDGKVWRGGYGPRLRKFAGISEDVDQLQYIIDLLKEDPESRRAVFAIYDPAVDSHPGLDIPCNCILHFLPRDGVLHAHVFTRSNDAMWGWSGINQFEWSILTQVVAAYAGLKPGSVTFSISSLHLYDHHYDKAQRIVDQTLLADNDLDAGMWADGFEDMLTPFTPPEGIAFDELVRSWFVVEGLIRTGQDSTVAISDFPEPMMQSWLWALYCWWNDMEMPSSMGGTSFYTALQDSPKPKPISTQDNAFMRSVNRLHRDKGAVYGISWRKRGETYSILPNVGRKIDRLGVGGAGDSEADTYVDLAVYLTKYRLFLEFGLDDDGLSSPCDDPDMIEAEFRRLDSTGHRHINDTNVLRLTEQLKNDFEVLLVRTQRVNRLELVLDMQLRAWGLAKFVAQKEGWEY